MILTIDLKKLLILGINLESYLLLLCLNSKNKDLITDYIVKCGKIRKESIDFLLEKDYIIGGEGKDKYSFDDFKLSDKAISVFFDSVDNWIQTWHNLWPKSIKSGGYLVRGDINACLKKMRVFVDKNPQYSKGIIIASTKKYLDEMKKDNYSYCKINHYFINKDGNSVLAGICEQMYDNVTNGKDEVGQYKEERL